MQSKYNFRTATIEKGYTARADRAIKQKDKNLKVTSTQSRSKLPHNIKPLVIPNLVAGAKGAKDETTTQMSESNQLSNLYNPANYTSTSLDINTSPIPFASGLNSLLQRTLSENSLDLISSTHDISGNDQSDTDIHARFLYQRPHTSTPRPIPKPINRSHSAEARLDYLGLGRLVY